MGGRSAAARRAFVARDPVMLDVVEALERAAQAEAPVLLLGELGVGREVMARWVHDASRDGPFVALRCGSMPPTVVETMLFGREPGALEPALRATADGRHTLTVRRARALPRRGNDR